MTEFSLPYDMTSLVPEGSEQDTSLAYALAARFWYEQEWTNQRLQFHLGKPHRATPLAALAGNIEASVPLFAAMIDDPATAAETYAELMTVRVIEDAEDSISADTNNPMTQILDIEAYAENVSNMFRDLMKPWEEERTKFLTALQLNAATYAEDTGVTQSHVFLNDKLYEDLIRQTYEPENFLRQLEMVRTMFSEDFLVPHFRQAFLDSLTPQVKGLMETDASVAEGLLALFNAPAFSDALMGGVEQYRRAVRGVVADTLVRYWGEDVLAQVPPDSLEM